MNYRVQMSAVGSSRYASAFCAGNANIASAILIVSRHCYEERIDFAFCEYVGTIRRSRVLGHVAQFEFLNFASRRFWHFSKDNVARNFEPRQALPTPFHDLFRARLGAGP